VEAEGELAGPSVVPRGKRDGRGRVKAAARSVLRRLDDVDLAASQCVHLRRRSASRSLDAIDLAILAPACRSGLGTGLYVSGFLDGDVLSTGGLHPV